MKQAYGHTADGMPVGLHTLTNAGGMQVRTTGHRGIVTSLLAPDRNGRFDDVAPGFDELDGHLARHPKFGAVCGQGGAVYRKRHGLCFECQHVPDSPNRPGFPTTALKPGQCHAQTTVYRFSRDT